MSAIAGPYARILAAARGSDLKSAVSHDFLLSIYLPHLWGWRPSTMRFLDRELQDDFLAIIDHLRTAPWKPDERDMDSLRAPPLGYWP
jgi:hypothetical protein